MYPRVIIAFLLGVLVGWYVQGLRGSNALLNEQSGTKDATITAQTAVISTQALQFQRFNEIAAKAHANATGNVVYVKEKQIEYRTILKKEPTCDYAVPGTVADGVLEYANRVRSAAVRATTGSADSTGDTGRTTGTMTYCQAVLWLPLLLQNVAAANEQLAGIRLIESERK